LVSAFSKRISPPSSPPFLPIMGFAKNFAITLLY